MHSLRSLFCAALLTAVVFAAADSPSAQHTARLVPGTEGLSPRNLVVLADTLYFFVCEVVCEVAGDAEGRLELWSYDAATDRAEPRVEFAVQLRDAPFPISSNVIDYDGALFFNADDGVHGDELWRYDPANGQATLVADLQPGTEGSTPSNFTIYDRALYFRATDEGHGPKLRSYRTGEGIRTLEHSPGPFLFPMTTMGDRLYLINGSSLVSYESTTDQFTTLTSPFDDGHWAAIQGRLTAYDGRIYARTSTQEHGFELWAYDPATDDFGLVADINPGAGTSYPSNLTVHGRALYFFADDDVHGYELWRYDGSKPPALVADINPGPDHSVPSAFTPFEERLYFYANDGTTGVELWMHDPSTEEVSLAVDLVPGSESSIPRWMTPYDSALYVATRTAAGDIPESTGGALWRIERTLPTSEEDVTPPDAVVFRPIFPNPSADAVTLRFAVPASQDVRVEAFDLLGRRVAVLAEGPYRPGEHTLRWDGHGLPSGLYVVRLQTDEATHTRRVALVR